MPDDPISAVIPNRDGAELLRRILPPLLRELPAGGSEVIVVDDASQDDSTAMLAQEFPEVRVIALRESIGFGEACNLGFREACHPLVLLLNSDMEVTPGSVAQLQEHMQEPGLFAAGPVHRNADPKMPLPPRESEDIRYQIGAPAGGGLFRREAYLELGGFDPLYFPFYWEDFDLGWTAWSRGWKILLDNRIHFLHLESVTVRKLYPAAYVRRTRTRNRFLFGWKNLRTPRLLTRFLLNASRRALADLVRRRDLSGILGALASLPLIPAARRKSPRGGLRDVEVLAHCGEPDRNLYLL